MSLGARFETDPAAPHPRTRTSTLEDTRSRFALLHKPAPTTTLENHNLAPVLTQGRFLPLTLASIPGGCLKVLGFGLQRSAPPGHRPRHAGLHRGAAGLRRRPHREFRVEGLGFRGRGLGVLNFACHQGHFCIQVLAPLLEAATGKSPLPQLGPDRVVKSSLLPSMTL